LEFPIVVGDSGDATRDSHFGVRVDKKHSRVAGGTWPKYKMVRFGEVSADSRAMKGAIHEETFSTNFPGGNTGDRRHIRSCSCHQTKGQRDVRKHLYRSQAQLSWRLFL
jgi:hypothetical protein